ncbi:hypothetical protein F4815DRAFT_198089 [Daldinia loculata]|uniref:uncharacterized protein n=1 Tax=Daldinia loculata TaxID=103429 RepID=UPI0020C29E70|nr:uncharacterized protein F4817DRAFT_138519 [Daldinia loculata]KAI1646460.1 hypothetical protein F4817DRAFT_138519 [Daldinia loculata]KAI2779209.1 hypothetical protein F4815DRAFT_198089 [Daldinia loculata]
MSNDSESEAVAQDFRDALEDLQSFDRTEISTLTVIARENTEHAHAISGALQDHIKRVVPQKKLPALYVLDSIVKNVGTPYTLYFGRKLYQTFMDAYASVDMPTRRKMDEMLRTWKGPVAGSLDTRPVFPPDVTRPIENALIKARTAHLQAQQKHQQGQQQLLGRGRPASQGVPYRETPTPPGYHPPPQANGYPSQAPVPNPNGPSYGSSSQLPPNTYPSHPSQPQPARSTPQPTPGLMAFQPPQLGGYGVPQAGISIDALNNDIQRLITASKAQIALNPHDPSIQTRLKALMDLQTILQTQNLPQDQLVLVKNQIADLAVTIRAPPSQTPTPTPIPQPQPAPVAVAPPPAPAPKVSLDSLFGAGALAALMARNSATPQASAPYHPPTPAAVHTPPPLPQPKPVESKKPVTTHQPPPPPSDPMALMNMLRQAGLLPGTAPVSSSTPVSRPTPSNSFPVAFNTPAMVPVVQHIRPSTLEGLTSDIVLKPSSLKQFRPHLLPFLFESLGPQCTQCGRRFPKNEEGKKKKTAHMDWHFRVNQRMAEAEKRGQHRSWLVDEVDWIKTREIVDEDYVAPSGDSNSASGGAAPKPPQLQYIPVPDDPSLANSVCSICQEKFETRWLDLQQEFVWPDTMKVGKKIYHASCYKEAFRDGGNTPAYSRGTPEPVTGKRKAEQDELASTRSKIKVEGT